MSTFNDIWSKLGASREYRAAFATAQFKRLVPFQIRALRKHRRMSQQELAQKANLTQGVISRAEDSNYGNLSSNTILKIADGFDCAFVGRFVSFSELDQWFINVSEDTVRVPSFEEEDRLFKLGKLQPRKTSQNRPKIKASPRVVRIDTRREPVRPIATAGAHQLSLPLSGDVGAGPQLVNRVAPIDLDSSMSSNRFQNVPAHEAPRMAVGGL